MLNENKLLQPRTKDLKEFVEKLLTDWGYTEKNIYLKCIKDAKKINLCKITIEDTKGPIKAFLVNWGMMYRVLNRRKDWEKHLMKAIRKNCTLINKFKNKDIFNFPNLKEYKIEIKQLYKEIRNIIGPTSASKVLHLLCPNFFPMWDDVIRKRLSKEKQKIGESGIGYFKYMVAIQQNFSKLLSKINKLSEEYKMTKLRIIDAYLWQASRKVLSQ